jgi:uncharacterized protein (DUF983 family)
VKNPAHPEEPLSLSKRRLEGPVAVLHGLCPRCANPTLFAGLVRFAPHCRACGLDFAAFNVGDGPAAFLIFLVGGIVVALAVWFELSASPPWWLHVLLWPPLTAALTLGGLRLAKAWLLQTEYSREACEAVPRETP